MLKENWLVGPFDGVAIFLKAILIFRALIVR